MQPINFLVWNLLDLPQHPYCWLVFDWLAEKSESQRLKGSLIFVGLSPLQLVVDMRNELV